MNLADYALELAENKLAEMETATDGGWAAFDEMIEYAKLVDGLNTDGKTRNLHTK